MTFAVIFSLESLARALNSTVIALQAYEILGSSQKVSMLATSVSTFYFGYWFFDRYRNVIVDVI